MPFESYTKDLLLIVNGQRFETSRFVADLLSPTIRKLHKTDETCNEFCIESNHLQSEYFGDFIKLVHFEPSHLSNSQVQVYSQYFYEFGNMNEYFHLH